MGKGGSALVQFIESIPDEKLQGFMDPNPTYTLFQSEDFRLDVQNITSGDPRCFNIQIQINRGTSISTLKKHAQKNKNRGTTVSSVLVPIDGSWDVATVRKALLENKKI